MTKLGEKEENQIKKSKTPDKIIKSRFRTRTFFLNSEKSGKEIESKGLDYEKELGKIYEIIYDLFYNCEKRRLRLKSNKNDANSLCSEREVDPYYWYRYNTGQIKALQYIIDKLSDILEDIELLTEKKEVTKRDLEKIRQIIISFFYDCKDQITKNKKERDKRPQSERLTYSLEYLAISDTLHDFIKRLRDGLLATGWDLAIGLWLGVIESLEGDDENYIVFINTNLETIKSWIEKEKENFKEDLFEDDDYDWMGSIFNILDLKEGFIYHASGADYSLTLSKGDNARVTPSYKLSLDGAWKSLIQNVISGEVYACAHCGRAITENEECLIRSVREIPSGAYCKECRNQLAIRCHDCGHYFSKDGYGIKYHEDLGIHVCQDCSDNYPAWNYGRASLGEEGGGEAEGALVCEHCGRSIAEEDAYSIRLPRQGAPSSPFCEDCRNQLAIECHDCGDDFFKNVMNYLENLDIYICPYCIDNYKQDQQGNWKKV